MKLIEKWRLAINCIKLSHNLKVNLISGGILCVMGLVYEIGIGNLANGIGAIMLLTASMYPAQMIYSVCGSQLVLSSPHKKALMTSVPTIITSCSGIVFYLVVIGIEGIRAAGSPEAAADSARTILVAGMALVLLEIYVGLAFKYFAVSVVAMICCLFGSYYLAGLFGDAIAVMPWLSEISIPVAAAVGLCLAALGSLLQYGVSLLVYKKPISRSAIYGLMRQQA